MKSESDKAHIWLIVIDRYNWYKEKEREETDAWREKDEYIIVFVR